MEAIDAVMEINRIFKANKWVDKDKNELAFNGFCNLFTKLAPEERKLVLELTENYHWISHDEYQDRIIQALESISESELVGITKIYFFAIIKPSDEHKVKSGEHLLYLIKACKRLMSKYSAVTFQFVTTLDQIQKLSLDPHERLFLVDDYIGSGETIQDCISELKKNASLASSVFKIVCIAIQEVALYALVTEGYGILKSIIVKRGITDYNKQPEIDQKKGLMRDIESNISGVKPYSLGYKETEALVTMMRTPDNTFPVFWRKFGKEGNNFEAPFARYEDS